ncbi:MAG: RHS repeat-associated core domain-containing protein [Pyrinomonadaceae bacterium]
MIHPESVLGQNPPPNVQYTNKAVDLGLRGNLTVNPSTRAIEIQIPLGSYTGRAGFNVPIVISYSSKVHRIKYEAFNPGHYSSSGVPIGDGYTLVSDRFAEYSSGGWTSSVGFPLLDYSAQGERYDMFGKAVGPDGQCVIQTDSPPSSYPCLTIDRRLFRMPDGSTHELRSSDQPRYPTDPILDDYYSVDGGRMRYQSSTQTLFMADGSRYILGANPKYIDRNGNTITGTDTLGRPIPYPPMNGTGLNGGTPGDSTYSLAGGSINYTFKWRYLDDPGVLTLSQPLQYIADSSCPVGTGSYSPHLFLSDPIGTHTCVVNGGSLFRPVVLYQILLPTGQAYTFTYNVYGEIDKVILPSGGYERYEYGQVGSLSNLQPPYAQANRGVTRRYVSASGSPADEIPPWQYSVGGSSVDITAPDNSLTTLSMYTDPSLSGTFGYSLDQPRAGRTSAENFYSPPDGNGTRHLLRRHLSEWSVSGSNATSQFPTAQQYATRNARLTKEVEIIFDPAGGPALAKAITHEYDLTYQFSSGVNETATNEFDYVVLDQTTAQTIGIGSVSLGLLKRRTEKTYLDATNAAYRDRNLLGMVTSVTVKDGLANILAQSSIAYDETGQPYSQLNDYGSVTNWTDPQTIYRGNPTTTSQWLNLNGSTLSTFPNGTYLTTHAQYDQCGSVRKTWNARDTTLTNPTQVSYLDVFSDGLPRNTYAFPTSMTTAVPDPSGAYGSSVAFTATSVYDFNTGNVVSTTDANLKTTSYDYSDPLNRLRQVTMPDTGRVRYNYFNTPGDLYVQVLTDEDSSRSIETRQYFDGLGRPTRGFLLDGTPSTPWSVTDTYYDTMGRVSQVSNPYRVSSPSASVPPTCSFCTTSAYDALGRVKSVTTPDSAQVTSSYGALTSGSIFGTTVLVTDQTGKSRRSLTDSLGRLARVDEPDVNGNLGDVSSPAQPTSYSYDALGNLHLVTQGTQQRFFMYDSLSRLLRARNPELAVNANFPALTDPITGNGQWSIAYTYDNNGNLTQKTDARGVVSSYGYDALNRNTVVDYSDTTPDSYRQYDLASNGKGRINQIWQGGTTTSATYIDQYDALGRPLLQRQRYETAGVWSASYQTSQTHDLAGHVKTLSYPSGRLVTYNYDVAGRLADKDASNLAFTGNLGDGGAARSYSTEISYSPLGGMTKEKFGTDTALYNKTIYNSRGQAAEIRVGTYHPTDSTWWNRGAIINHYSDSCWGSCGGSNSSTPMTDNNGNLKKQEVYIPNTDVPNTQPITSYTTWWQQYNYDALNRLDWVREISSAGAEIWKQDFAYDRYGNRTIDQTNTWGPAAGPAINKKNFTANTANDNRLGVPAGQSGTMSYDNAGNLTTDTYSGLAVTRAYDAENRMTSETQSNGYVAGSYGYNADGQRVRRKVGSVESWQIYGLAGELLAEYAANAAAVSPQKEYGYRNGQLLITAEAASRANVASATNGATATAQNYTADGVYPGMHFQPAFATDGVRHTSTDGASYWRDEHGLSSWLQVDFNGSKTIDEVDVYTMGDYPFYTTQTDPTASQTFSQVQGATAYNVQYWTGSAWQTVTGGSVSVNNLVWKKLTFTAVTTSKLRVVVNACADNVARIVELEAWGTAAGAANINWLVTDQLGTPRMIFDKTGALATTKRHDYLPFGEEIVSGTGGRTPAQGYSADGVRQKFTQKERDIETGLDYFGARYYASAQGRFTSVDQGAPELLEPQTWNRYQYARNNPLYYVDADGNKDEPAKNQRVNQALASDPTLLEVIKASTNFSQRGVEDALNRGELGGNLATQGGNKLRGLAGEAIVIDSLRAPGSFGVPLGAVTVSQPGSLSKFGIDLALPKNIAPDIGAIYTNGQLGNVQAIGILKNVASDAQGGTTNLTLSPDVKFGLYEVKAGFSDRNFAKGAAQVAATAGFLKASGLPGIAVLAVDKAVFEKLKPNERARIYSTVTQAGGYIQFYDGLAARAAKRSRDVIRQAR